MLKSSYHPLTKISDPMRVRMYELMDAYYDHVSEERFDKDLMAKDGAIILYDNDEVIQGFSTVVWNPVELDGVDVIYSGDTIIDRKHWGSRELVTEFCRLCGDHVKSHGKPLYWFLISKGHRTYQLLPLFSKHWFPMPSENDEQLARYAGMCAEAMFGESWIEDRGVLNFEESLGQMKPSIAVTTEQRCHNKYVKYFLSRNPGYLKGEELVCLVEMHEQNLRGTALKWYRKGLLG